MLNLSGLEISLDMLRISTHPCNLSAIESNSQFLLGSLSVEEELFIKEWVKIPLSLCL